MQELASRFERNRPRLRALARRLAGPVEADDVVQEAWIRLVRQGEPPVNLEAWLTTVTARLALDHLRRRHLRDDPWDVDVVPLHDVPGATPEDEALLAEAVGTALAVVVDRLSPAERVAFVLHDVFGVAFAEIAPALGRSEAATKMLASRARRRVKDPGSREPDPELAVVRAFLEAARGGDLDRLTSILAPGVTLTAHLRDRTVTVAGNEVVARRASVAAARAGRTQLVLVGGAIGILSRGPGGAPAALLAFTVVDGSIIAVESWNDPDRLSSRLSSWVR